MTARNGTLVRLALAGLLVVMPAACVPAGNGEPLGDDTRLPLAPPVEVGTSRTGNYLAGRHAQVVRDMARASRYLDKALSKDPEETGLLRRTFLVMAADGRMDEAVALARRLITTDPAAPMANYLTATDDLRASRFEAAETLLSGLSERGLNVFMVPLMKAWALAGQGHTDAALTTLEALRANEGFHALHDLHAALINDLAGRTDAAGEAFKVTAKTQSNMTLRLVMLVGTHFERAGRPDEARRFYDAYLAKHPGSRLLDKALARLKAGSTPPPDVATPAHGAAEALFGIASSLRQQNARETALIFGRMALHLKPDFPIVQILVASILEADERLESANAVYAAIDPDSPFAWSARIRMAANLDSLDRTNEAIAQLRAMADAEPKEYDPLVDMGDILRSRERFAEAVEAYDEAIARLPKLDKRHWGLFYARGIALERSDQWKRSEQDFLKALEFRPDQPYVLNYLGYSWVEKGLHLDKAQDMIKKAVSLRPNDGYIVDSLGWVYYQLGNYEGAVKELERAVELRPDDPVINDHLGDAYWQVGRFKEARFQWRRSLGLDPEPELKEIVEKKLKQGLTDVVPIGGNG